MEQDELYKNLTSVKYVLESEINRKYNINVQVGIQRGSTRKFKDLYIFTLVPNGNMFQAQHFEIYRDNKGNFYWDKHNPNTKEHNIEKPIN